MVEYSVKGISSPPVSLALCVNTASISNFASDVVKVSASSNSEPKDISYGFKGEIPSFSCAASSSSWPLCRRRLRIAGGIKLNEGVRDRTPKPSKGTQITKTLFKREMDVSFKRLVLGSFKRRFAFFL